jgi:integration host factor subunit alpha
LSEILTFGGFFGAKFDILNPRWLLTLVQEESVKLRSFGKFHLRSKRERVGRNPKTGAKASICARKVVTFKASPILVARVNTAPTGDLQL